MKLTENTIQILKNFAGINPNIVINKGSVIKTMAEAKNVLATATIEDEFPSTFGIYDLNEFLGVLNLLDSPTFTPDAGFATISDGTGRQKIKYYFTDPEMLTTPTRDIKMPEPEIKFILDNATLSKLKSAAGVLGHNEVAIEPSGSALALTILSSENKTSNTYSIQVPGDFNNQDKFKLVMSINNLKKIVPTNYEVKISSKLISHFHSTDPQIKVEYFIALEKNSTYGE